MYGDPTLAPGIPSLVCVLCADANATGKNDGSNWKDAYNFLQDALADANLSRERVEIRVVQGLYTPDSNSAVPYGKADKRRTV